MNQSDAATTSPTPTPGHHGFEIPPQLNQTRMKYRVLSFKRPFSEVSCGFVRLRNVRKRIFPTHTPYYGLLLVLRGRGRLTTHQRQHLDIQPGHVIQFFPHESSILQHHSHDWLEASLSIDHALIEHFMHLNDIDFHQPLLNPRLSGALVHQFDSIYRALMLHSRHQLPGLVIRLQQLILQIHHMSQANPISQTASQQLEQACQLLADSMYFNENINVIAQHVGLETRQLRYLFQKHLKESPGQFRLKHKMAAAVAMLTQGQYNITQVAYELGYSDPFTFSRQFKIHHGFSPSQYHPG